MKLKINYSIGDFYDYLFVEGETLVECRRKAKEELNRRNIAPDEAWAEEVEE